MQKACGPVKRAAAADGTVFPEDPDEMKSVPFEDLSGLLDSIGWTVDFIASYITMCLLGVLSDKTDTRVYFDSNKLYMAA